MAASAFDKWWYSQPSMGSELIAAQHAWDAATKLAEEKVFIHQHPQHETAEVDFDSFTSYTRPFST